MLPCCRSNPSLWMPYCNSCGSNMANNEPEEICCGVCLERLQYLLVCLNILELRPGVSLSQIKEAYRDLAKVWHPDRFGTDERIKAKAHDRFTAINTAYRALCAEERMLKFLEYYVPSDREWP
jgi:DnaJ-domain-containing protein 1